MELKDLDIKDEKDLIQFGEDFFEDSAKGKRKLERQWLINILFILGDQLCKVNSNTNEITRVNVEQDPEWMIRVVNNRIIPIYRTMIAKLTKNRPIPLCTANSREDKDVQAARGAGKLLENHWLNLNMNENHQEIAGWLVATGNCFAKQFYNPKKGDSVALTEDVKKSVKDLIDKDGGEDDKEQTENLKQSVDKKDKVPIGDTDLVIRNPFNCYPQRGKTRISKMTMFGDSEFLSPAEVFDKYGVEIGPDSKSRDRHIYNASIGEIINTGELADSTMTESLIEIHEMYILPCKKFPKGGNYKWAGDKFIGKLEECVEIPFTHFGSIRIPGKFWCESIVTDLIPMQIRWNELLSKIEMHNDLYNDPPIVVDPNVIDIEDWTNQPGLILERKITGAGAEPPWVMKVPMLDQSILQEINILDKQFEIVPVMNKVSFGKDTPNARSGLAINYLQEKDDDVIRPLIDELESSYTRVFKRDFKLCQDNYKEDRGFAIVGKDNKLEWVEFMKSDLTANIDVKVEPGSAMPRSVAASQSMILELMDRGFFIDPRTQQMDYARISSYMEFGGIGDMYADATLDVEHAKRTIDVLISGEPILVQEWYNVNAHLYEVNRFRKTTSYDDLDDMGKFMVDNYANQCLFLLSPKSSAGGGGGTGNGSAGMGASGAVAGSTVPPSVGATTAAPVQAMPQQQMQQPMQMMPQQMPMQMSAPNPQMPTTQAPLTDGEIAQMLSNIKKLKPDMWKSMKNMSPQDVIEELNLVRTTLATNPV